MATNEEYQNAMMCLYFIRILFIIFSFYEQGS